MEICFAVCSLGVRIAWEGRPGRALSIELSHGRKKGRTPFASKGLGKRTNYNRRCDVLFMNDTRSSAPQFPARMGAGLGSGIGNWVGRLNCTPG